MKSKHTAILISTYDGAEDLWEPLHGTYQKYWSDCPFKIYLGTNFIDPKLKMFEPLKIGKEESWSDNILKCLEKIPEDNILLIFDDVFLYKKINSKDIEYFSDLSYKRGWSYLRLSPYPSFDEEITQDVGVIYSNRHYRTSTAWAIFKKSTLKDLLVQTETAWEFEIFGSGRSDKYLDFYSVNKLLLPYLNGVVKGKWVRGVYKHLQKEGFSVSDKRIKRMNHFEEIRFKFIVFRSWVFTRLIPKRFQLIIRRALF